MPASIHCRSCLAGEANNPGSFSKRAVNLTADLDSQTAKTFEDILGLLRMVEFSHGGQAAKLPRPHGAITTGITTFTTAGRELASVCTPAQVVDGFFEFICAQWSNLCERKATLSGGVALSYGEHDSP